MNGIWRAQQAAKKVGKSVNNNNKIVDECKNEYTDADLTTLLLFPLIESQSKSDPGLRNQIVQLLLVFLQNLSPLSVKGPKQQLDSIETLLVQWLHDQDDNASETTINCLLALACARDSIDTLINTIDVLRKTLSTKSVGNVQIFRFLLKTFFCFDGSRRRTVSCRAAPSPIKTKTKQLLFIFFHRYI